MTAAAAANIPLHTESRCCCCDGLVWGLRGTPHPAPPSPIFLSDSLTLSLALAVCLSVYLCFSVSVCSTPPPPPQLSMSLLVSPSVCLCSCAPPPPHHHHPPSLSPLLMMMWGFMSSDVAPSSVAAPLNTASNNCPSSSVQKRKKEKSTVFVTFKVTHVCMKWVLYVHENLTCLTSDAHLQMCILVVISLYTVCAYLHVLTFSCSSKSAHIIPLLYDLHWLRIPVSSPDSIQNGSHLLPRHSLWYSSSIPLRVASSQLSFSLSSLSLGYSDIPCS